MTQNAESVCTRGIERYERDLRQVVDIDSNRSKILVLDVDTGEYAIASEHLVAIDKLREVRPKGVFYSLRIGFPTLGKVGGGWKQSALPPINPALLPLAVGVERPLLRRPPGSLEEQREKLYAHLDLLEYVAKYRIAQIDAGEITNNDTEFDPEEVDLVYKMAINHIRRGASTMDEVVTEIYNVGKDIDDDITREEIINLLVASVEKNTSL